MTNTSRKLYDNKDIVTPEANYIRSTVCNTVAATKTFLKATFGTLFWKVVVHHIGYPTATTGVPR